MTAFPEIEHGGLVQVGSGTLFPIVEELLKSGKHVEITVTGNSMYPMIRSLRDTVILESASFDEVKKLDIVLVCRRTGKYVLHRLSKKEKHSFTIIGDRQDFFEKMNPAEDIVIARAIAIRRGSRSIPCASSKWRFIARIWLFLRPLRNMLIILNGQLLPKVRRLFRFGKTPEKNQGNPKG